MKRLISSRLRECSRELNEIQRLIHIQGVFNAVTPFLIKYSVIRACGMVEVVFKSIIADFFSKSKIPQVSNFIEQEIRKSSMNPSYKNICGLLKKFDTNWNLNFRQAIAIHPDKTKLLDSLDSLNEARNRFAHGNISSTISIGQVQDYFTDAVIILKILDQTVK